MDKDNSSKHSNEKAPFIHNISELDTEYDDEIAARLPSEEKLLLKINIAIYGAIALFVLASFVLFG